MAMSLKDRAKQFSTLLPFMDGREKGDFDDLILKGKTVTIKEYGFLQDNSNGTSKDYVAFIIAEDDKHFYFGGQVLTDNMKQLDTDGYRAEIENDGLPVKFTTRKSKNKDAKTGLFLKYTAVEFYPEPMIER